MKKLIMIIGIVLMAGCNTPSNPYADIPDKGVWVKLKEGETIGYYTMFKGKVYGGASLHAEDMSLCFKPLAEVDTSTFRVCKGTGYAKDKRHVYYPIDMWCIDGLDCAGCFFVEYIVKGANPKTFKYIGDGYGVDGHKKYDEGVRVREDIKENTEPLPIDTFIGTWGQDTL